MPLSLRHLDRRAVMAVLALVAAAAAGLLAGAWWLSLPAVLVAAVFVRELGDPRVPVPAASREPDRYVRDELRGFAYVCAFERRVAFGAPWAALVLFLVASADHRQFFLSLDGAYFVLAAAVWLTVGWLYLRRWVVSTVSLAAADPKDTSARVRAFRVLGHGKNRLVLHSMVITMPPMVALGLAPLVAGL